MPLSLRSMILHSTTMLVNLNASSWLPKWNHSREIIPRPWTYFSYPVLGRLGLLKIFQGKGLKVIQKEKSVRASDSSEESVLVCFQISWNTMDKIIILVNRHPATFLIDTETTYSTLHPSQFHTMTPQ
jgi:hypothetical protein